MYCSFFLCGGMFVLGEYFYQCFSSRRQCVFLPDAVPKSQCTHELHGTGTVTVLLWLSIDPQPHTYHHGPFSLHFDLTTVWRVTGISEV